MFRICQKHAPFVLLAGQAASVVDELAQANRELSQRELYRRGFSVGREHIASNDVSHLTCSLGSIMGQFKVID